VDPRAGLDTVSKRKIPFPCPYQESNLGRPARSLVTILSHSGSKISPFDPILGYISAVCTFTPCILTFILMFASYIHVLYNGSSFI